MQQEQLFETIFNLSQQFEPLHERLLSLNSIMRDNLNNVYILTAKRIYVLGLKRIIVKKDWITTIIDVKEMVQNAKNKEIVKYSIDPITQSYNGAQMEQQDRISQIQFMKFAVTPANIPILHSSLLSQRLYTLNNDYDLIAFHSVKICPLFQPPSFYHPLCVLLNNGDSHLLIYNEHTTNYELYQNVNAYLSGNQQNIKEDTFWYQIDLIAFSEVMLSPNLFDFPFCFFLVVANQQLHIFKMKQEYKLTIRKFEKIQLDAKCVHESLIVEFCSIQNHLHIILQTVKGKLYFITLKMSENDYKCQQTIVETFNSGLSCLSFKWIEYQKKSSTKCNCCILAQYNKTLQVFKVNQPSCIEALQLPCLSKLIGVSQKQDQNLFYLQNGLCLQYFQNNICSSKQVDIYSICGMQSTSNQCMTILGGQPDIVQQKKETQGYNVLQNIIKNIINNMKIYMGIGYIIQPLNFDDLELLLITKKDLSYNELIKIGLLLYDEVSYLEGMNISRRSEFVEQANMFKKNVLKLVGDNEYILNQICSILLINLLLMEEKEFKGWQKVYIKLYYQYLEQVEEILQLFQDKPKLRWMRQKIIDQMNISKSNFQNGTILSGPNSHSIKQVNGYMMKQWMEKQKVNITANMSGDEDKCPICDVPLDKSEWTVCSQGHQFIRCNITQMPLKNQKIIRCVKCKFQIVDIFSCDFGIPYQLFLVREYVCPICCCQCKTVL